MVRLITGPAWWPDTIRLKTNDDRGLHSFNLLRTDHLQLNQTATAIEVPSFMLNQHLFESLKETDASNAQSAKSTRQSLLAYSLSESLLEILSLYISTNEIDLQYAADLLGVSPRTLQRQLAKENTRFTTLVDTIRFNSAIPLLKNHSVKLVDIAYDLGYSDPAHFTRAFRRWSGVTPKQYQKQLNTMSA